MSGPARSGDEPSALPPLGAALLVGGGRRRMGSPKQLLELDGETFAARIARVAEGVAGALVICGAGEIPPALSHLPRLADPEGVAGPLAGLLAAFAHAPGSAWLALSCDQPRITPSALAWLISERRAGAVAVLSRLTDDRVEPLPAIYEPGVRPALAELARARGAGRSLQRLADFAAVRTPRVPPELAAAFAGANDPAELDRLRGRGSAA